MHPRIPLFLFSYDLTQKSMWYYSNTLSPLLKTHRLAEGGAVSSLTWLGEDALLVVRGAAPNHSTTEAAAAVNVLQELRCGSAGCDHHPVCHEQKVFNFATPHPCDARQCPWAHPSSLGDHASVHTSACGTPLCPQHGAVSGLRIMD